MASVCLDGQMRADDKHTVLAGAHAHALLAYLLDSSEWVIVSHLNLLLSKIAWGLTDPSYLSLPLWRAVPHAGSGAGGLP